MLAVGGAAVVVVFAAAFIAGLRRQTLRSTAIVNRLLDVREASSESDAIAWSLVAQGFPNFSSAQALRANGARITGDVRYLERAGAPVENVLIGTSVFEQELGHEQQLIADHRLSQANDEAANGVDGTEQVLRDELDRLRVRYQSAEDAANARLYSGTLISLGLVATLVALLASAFAASRRRTLAAERTALARSERRFRALVHRATDAVLIADDQDRISYAAGAVARILGSEPEALLGRRVEELAPPDQRSRARQLLERVRREGPAPTPSEWSMTRADGTTDHYEIQSADFTTDPDVSGIVLTIRDVTGRHEMELQLRHASLHDPLTGLPNRTLFEDRVAQALSRMRRSGQGVGVLYIDLDDFKAVNDSLGHASGDDLLRIVAGRIDGALRGSDTAARLGGDEFACLLDGLDGEAEALSIARRLIAALAPDAVIGERRLPLRASLGVAMCATPGLSAEELIRDADLAMYAAKNDGRGGLAVFEPGMLTDARQRLDLREDLAHAATRGELSLAYQPLVQIDGRTVTGVEALLRWHHAEYGPVAPDRFIPLAEQSGIIVELGRWVINQALSDLTALAGVAPDLRVNINVAPRELAEPDYVATVAAALARHKIAAGRVTLELTESQLPDDASVIERLQSLSELGVQLSIDDFGTGQSSLARLSRLPVNQVKLDRSFLSAVDVTPETATLVRSMVELGHALGLQMVAEGIERESQVAVLSTLPCHLGQGYLFGRPLDRDAIASMLARAAADARDEGVASRTPLLTG